MATFKAYPNGVTMGHGNPQPVGGPRGEVVGWSAGAVRRHKRWLYSVVAPKLTGHGYAYTLTLRHTPATNAAWTTAMVRFLDRLRKVDGVIRWHWVVEWQRRGTPHLHMAVYGESDWFVPHVLIAWFGAMAEFDPAPIGQLVTPITGPVGWLKYLSKHASRGVEHYQRQGKPAGWKKTGRLWGKGGSWPVQLPIEGAVNRTEFARLRRLIRAYLIADAVSRGDVRAAVYLRGMLHCNDRNLSSVRGISEWVPPAVFMRMLEASTDLEARTGDLVTRRPQKPLSASLRPRDRTFRS